MIQLRYAPSRRGIMLIWLGLSLAAIISMVALAMDGGRLMTERQHAQASADAAALAAAGVLHLEYPVNGGLDSQGNARAAALQTAAANGITDGTNAAVTVNIPPTQGDFAAKPGYAEVIIASRLNVSFSAIFGHTQLTVRARAAARGVKTGQVMGMYALKSSGNDSIHLHGNTVTVNVINAPVYINSPANDALHLDKGTLITASEFNLVGVYTGSLLSVNGPINMRVPPTPDPLAALPPPDPTGQPVRSLDTLTVKGPLTISPGIYIGGIDVVKGGVLIMEPGVYILQGGGFIVDAGGAVQGTEVMIYNGGQDGGTAKQIKMDDNCMVTLRPPTTGTYAGISFFQDRLSNAGVDIKANHDKTITGAIYAPAAKFQLEGPTTVGRMDTLGGVLIGMEYHIHGRFEVNNMTEPRPAMSQYGLVD